MEACLKQKYFQVPWNSIVNRFYFLCHNVILSLKEYKNTEIYNFQDDNEGPVTKSIRLTSSLILRNLVIYSTNGRRQVNA
jgi:hypothetical protein